MIEQWHITIPELTGRTRRRVWLYLPESYTYNDDRHYPVLYMFDGQNIFFDEDATFGKSWGMNDFMEATGTDLIIAAVECSHSSDHGRLSEYSPYDFSERTIGTIEGKGAVTMDWLTGVFKPYIDAHYRTLPDRTHTFIAGSSMGGLMSIFALLHYNGVFSRAAALSPSLFIAPSASEEMIRSSHPAPDTILYMDYGTKEMGKGLRMRRAFGKTASLLLEKGVLLDARIVPGGEHCEACWEQQIPFFMNTLMYDIDDIVK
ncbi:MAG: alpha/beta hydrolase [Clostridiales bacterium]|nr:alpha/beta hydrolase [Clostridiales bacterium]